MRLPRVWPGPYVSPDQTKPAAPHGPITAAYTGEGALGSGSGGGIGTAHGYARAALLAAAVFALLAGASAAGWLLPLDAALLRAIMEARSCTGIAVSGLASFVAAIESAALLTGLLALGLAGAGWGWRAVWVGAWALCLPLELALKLTVQHPHPIGAAAGLRLVCEGTSPFTNPALSIFTDPTRGPLLNPELHLLQPLGGAVGHTFPSGYVARLTFFAVLLGFWVWGRLAGAPRAGALGALGLGVLALAYSRLVLGWHWPSDVLGGLALGTVTACVARAGWALTPALLRRFGPLAGSGGP